MEFLKEMDDTKTTSDSASRRPHGAGSSSAYGGTSTDHHHHHTSSAGFRPLHTRAASTPMGRPLSRAGAYSQPNSPAHTFEPIHDPSSGAGRSKSPHARLEVNGQTVRPGSKSRSRERGAGAGSGTQERSRLLQRSYSTADLEGQHGESMAYTGPGKVAGGTVMGIHNLAIVFPQFIVGSISALQNGKARCRSAQARRKGVFIDPARFYNTCQYGYADIEIAGVASIIFEIFDGDADTASLLAGGGSNTPGSPGNTPPAGPRAPKNGVVWVLRFGGLMALIGALISRKVPPTKTEKAMRRRLAEMREESEE